MNAGKLVAQIAALAIIVYCSYSAIISAIPLDKDDLQNPLEGLDTMSVTTSLDGGNLNVNISGNVTSNLPQDIVDVKVAFYIGKDATKITLASTDIGTIASKAPTPVNGSASIPICTILGYSVCSIDSDGHMKIPIRTAVEFKYLQWQSAYLIDLGITVNMNYETTVPTPEFTYDSSDNSVTMDLDLDVGEDLVSSIVEYIADGTYDFECDGAHFSATIDKSGSIPHLELTASGNATETAAQILNNYLEEHDELVLNYGGNAYTINKENASSFIEILDIFYGKVTA